MKAIAPFFITAALFATDIDVVVKNTLHNNPELKKYESVLDSKEYDIKNSTLYKNPVLTIGLNDISLDEPDNRGLEPMQTNYIAISQQITDSDKLELNKKINIYDKTKAKLFLEDKKDKLLKDIYSIYLKVQNLQSTIDILEQKRSNIKKIQEYHSTHLQNAMAFRQSIQNDLVLEQISLMIDVKKEKIDQLFFDLKEISNLHIEKIESVTMPEFKDDINTINDHKLIKLKEALLDQSKIKSQLAKENESSDYTLTLGYYNRESFDDYVSVAVKIPLNIYDKEKNLYLKSKVKVDEKKSDIETLKNSFEKSYRVSASKLKSAKRSIKFTKNMILNLEKEIELIKEQNIKDSVMKILNLENKILDQKLSIEEYMLSSSLMGLNLSYLTSNLQREKYE